jgi:hypothetical protein
MIKTTKCGPCFQTLVGQHQRIGITYQKFGSAYFMAALGHEVMFTMGLNDQPFPVGFKTSKLTKAQMSDLIEFVYAYGAQHNVKWSEENAEYYD